MNGTVLTFYLENIHFGLDIRLVKEINRNTEYTLVPDSSEAIAGLLNLRGQVVTLLQLAVILGRTPETKPKACIVLKSDPREVSRAALLIEKLGDVLEICDDQCEQPPANVSGIDSSLVEEVVKLDDGLLLILNLEEILAKCH